MNVNEDDRLMMQIATGDINAFELLVRRYQNQAIMFCYGQLSDYQLLKTFHKKLSFAYINRPGTIKHRIILKGFSIQ